jgi:hypothetical protein
VDGREQPPDPKTRPKLRPKSGAEPGTEPAEEHPWASSSDGEEPEPDWAEQIRSARRDRGAKLREVYSRFADEPTPLDDEADTE